MRVEKINDTQFLWSLDKKDFVENQLKLQDFLLGTTKVQTLFQKALEMAEEDFQFQVEGYLLYCQLTEMTEDKVCFAITKKKQISENQQLPENVIEPGQDLFLLYRFETLENVIDASRILNGRIHVNNSLYQVDNQYYLMAEPDTEDEQQMNTCGIVWTEFAPLKAISSAQKAYMEEHHPCIIAENAMETLATL
jgi:negative regulator of genetic competence, sporulation and motility